MPGPQADSRLRLVAELTEAINAGRTFEELFEIALERLRAHVPYHRLGVALVDGAPDRLRLVAARADGPMELAVGYQGRLDGSGLEEVLRAGRVQVLNDLEAHLLARPSSDTIRRLVREGMKSSLAVPLVVRGRPVGVLFFSSRERDAYTREHEDFLRLVSGHIAISVERSRLIQDLEEKRADLARACEELKQSQEVLVHSRSLAAVGELAATVAHEIKNPLAGISGAIQVLRDSFAESDSRREVVQEVLGQVRRLDHTVRDLLIFARPWTPAMAPFDLGELAGRVIAAAGKTPAGEGLRLWVESGGPSEVLADPQLLEHLLINLVQNACDATPRGGSVAVRIHTRPGDIEITVTDTGCGIPDDVRERLFQPFVSTKARGTGLGLAISKKIAEAHGGTIRVESERGAGTEVRTRLPRIGSPGKP